MHVSEITKQGDVLLPSIDSWFTFVLVLSALVGKKDKGLLSPWKRKMEKQLESLRIKE